MKVVLTIEVSESVSHRTNSIRALSDRLSGYFSSRDYGCDLVAIYIGTICVSPEFKFFSTIRPPKYVRYREYVLEGIRMVEDRIFGFDVELDHDAFLRQSDEQNQKMLARTLVSALGNFDKLPAKVKDFNKDGFREDLKMFLLSSGLI